MSAVIEMKGIGKSFPGVRANNNINLTVDQGEIHVLLGENGAGKSTLMNILYGLYTPDEGEIFVKGKGVKISNPNIAISLGIGMVHQHFMLVPPFSVTENIVLGSEPKKGLALDTDKAISDVEELSKKYELKVDPRAKIQDISVGMQQRVEILKTLYRGAEILILDEPTAVLTPQEIEELGVILKSLVNQGKSIILITHKLKEVMSMSDKVTIIRRGKVIDTLETSKTNIEELAEKMVGRKVSLTVEKEEVKLGEPILEVKGVKTLDNRGLEAVKGVDFEVRSGEIFGIAGVDGNGQNELVQIITGLRKAAAGEVLVKGKSITNLSPKNVIESGVGYIPEDRHKRGLILDFPLSENTILGSHRSKSFKKGLGLDYRKIRGYSRKLIKEFDVRTPNERVHAKSLSGGNQQKLIIARELDRDPQLLIASQPTRGLDVGAIEFVHHRLIEQRNRGKAVLLVSLELDEIMALSDRIAVMYDGKIVGVVDAKDATELELGIMMAGGRRSEMH
ncbi:ABC transporter ATP-binding protein [Lutispora saccharofermentans]|uniref:ABC transporter ATP-binding protein n=1 Tax=Lutispora saccharofermentans TaxID=3024236 RepID=A0ABT1NB47_9FIRM|nr:ABC transporter ATP-binding protein [Lutispora saccharofermentans]MCQ1528341.1 ABC transporter ATP-binding protein [Lutispora saccharofermentans]